MTPADIRTQADMHYQHPTLAPLLRALADVLEAAKIAATAELYDPQTGTIDADVLYIVRSECRKAVNRVEWLKP